MSATYYKVGPESYAAAGQLYPVAPNYAFVPGPAIGPMLGANTVAIPVSTLPAGAVSPSLAGPMGSVSSLSGRSLALVLAAAFVVGVLILDRVHWRA